MKGSSAIFKKNMEIVMALEVHLPASAGENKFSPYTDKCHEIKIGTLRTVTQASNIRLALVKFLSLTRTQVAPCVLILLSLARWT